MDRHCWLIPRTHQWSDRRQKIDGDKHHLFKYCYRCGARKMTYHVSCNPACWGGPC